MEGPVEDQLEVFLVEGICTWILNGKRSLLDVKTQGTPEKLDRAGPDLKIDTGNG
jgi:hypothetical protein